MTVERQPNSKENRSGYGPPPSVSDCARMFDVCVIGSGAAGSITASELVAAGLEVVMLEQGGYVGPETSYEEIIRESEMAYARQANGCWSLSGYPWTTCNVGGGTVFYGGASFRYRKVDFDPSRHLPDADLPVVWPYQYEDLAPYYDEVEDLIGVASASHEDPTAPPGRRGSSLPPVAPSPAGRVIYKAARSLGLRPFPTPLAITTQAYRGRSACSFTQPCIEHPCEIGAKGDAYTVFVKSLLQRPNFRLFAGLKAVRLRREKQAQVNSVQTIRIDSGENFTFRARLFVVACNAIQSAALLLRSGDRWCPSGLGNEYDMVGRGLCFKLNEYVVGYLPDEATVSHAENDLAEGAGPFSTVSLTDYYLNSDCPTGLGGLIYENRYGFRYAMRPYGRVLRLECLLSDQPSRHNRIALSNKLNSLGAPYVVIDYQVHPRDAARLEFVIERMQEILIAAGCRWIRREPTDFSLGSCHLHGTCRSGDDPRTSVVDVNSRVHSLENVYVVDGAFMPFPGSVNPTLTIQAHALKTARHLVRA